MNDWTPRSSQDPRGDGVVVDVAPSHRVRVALVVGLCLGLAYLAINVLSSRVGYAVNVMTSWDQAIPFIPEWVWAYNLNIPMPLFLILYAQKSEQLAEVVAGYLVLFSFSALCFVLIPVQATALRAVLPDNPSDLSMQAVAFYYWFDGVGNCLPSLHVSYSIYAGCWGLALMPRRLAWPYVAVGIAITLSTMFVKQHYVADVVLGVASALAVFGLQFGRGIAMRQWLPSRLHRFITTD